MFDLGRRYNRRYNRPIVAPIQIKHVHSSIPYQRAIYEKYGRHGRELPSGYGALGQTFSNLFKKLDFLTILERYYLRFIIFPCFKSPLKPLVFPSLLCVNRALLLDAPYDIERI